MGVSLRIHMCMCFGMGMSHYQDPHMTTEVRGCGGVGVWVGACMYVLRFWYESRSRFIHDNCGAGVWGGGDVGVWECGGVSMCVHVCMCFGMDMSHDQDPSMTTSVLGCRNVGMWGCPCVFIHVCASVWV